MYQRIIQILLGLFTITSVYGATPSTTPAASPSATVEETPKQQVIDSMKERLATKVAELRQVQKKAIVGTVKDISVSTITVETKTSDVKIELADQIKVFQNIKGKRTALTTDDISQGDMIVVFGDYDTTLDVLNAKVIIIQDPLPARVSGAITDVDKKNYTVSVETSEGQSYVIDIEKTTIMFAYDSVNGIGKGGFSKVEIGDSVAVVGTVEPKKVNQLSGLRVLDLGNITGITPTPTPDQSATATGSATKKPTPKATPEATPTPSVAS